MRRYSLIVKICTISVLLAITSVQTIAEDNSYIALDQLNNLTLLEAKDLLEKDQETIQLFIGLVSEKNSMRFELFSSDKEKSQPSFNDDPYEVSDSDTTKTKIAAYFAMEDEVYLRHRIDYPTSAIGLYLDAYDVEKFFGAKRTSKDFPILSLRNIQYADGTEEKSDMKFFWEGYNNIFVDLKDSKPVESISLNILYTLPLEKEYFLSTGKTLELADGVIKLLNQEGNKVKLSLSNEKIIERIVEVDAIHANGKILSLRGKSSYSQPSKAKIIYMKRTNSLLKVLIKRIGKKSILDKLFGKKNIESIEALKTELKKITKPTNEEEKQTNVLTYNFSGEIKKVRVVIRLGRTKVFNKNVVIKTHPREPNNNLGYFIARDKKTEKEGLVGKDGKWLVQPKYKSLDLMNDYYYRGKYKDDLNQLYWLNTKKNTLEPVDYQLDEIELYDGHLANIEKITNGPEGLIDAKTGRIIIPMVYNYLRFNKGLFDGDLYENGKETIVVYTKKGKQIIKESDNYNSIKIFSINSIVAKHNGENSLEDELGFFDKKGKKYSYGVWNDYRGDFGKSKLLLVKSWKRISENKIHTCSWAGGGRDNKYYCGKSAYVNIRGEVVINASKYRQVEQFSNGLAAVQDKKTELWGYINTNGKLVIPYIYKKANYFQEKYAYVEKAGAAFFIDKKNRIFKKLSGRVGHSGISIDGNKARYDLYNGETYDANGALIKKK